MSTSIDLYKYNFDKLVKEIMDTQNITDKDMLEKILLAFGEKIGDTYILLNNECWESYNSYYGVMSFIDEYYKVEDSFECLWSKNIDREECNCNRNKWDVTEELGITFPESEED